MNGFQPLCLVTHISSLLMNWSTHLMGKESLCCYMSTLQNINLMFRGVLNSFPKISTGRFEPHSWRLLQVSPVFGSDRLSSTYVSRSCIHCHTCTQHNFLSLDHDSWLNETVNRSVLVKFHKCAPHAMWHSALAQTHFFCHETDKVDVLHYFVFPELGVTEV